MAANPEIDPEITSKISLINGFRKMRLDDIDEIIKIERSVYSHPWSASIFSDCMQVGYNCWVYLDQDRLVAYGLISVAANEAHILNLCVMPDSQGKGFGRLMLRKLMQLAEERHGNSIFLEVRESNAVALTLYDNEGFNRIGVRKGYYPGADGREDALVYAKELNIDSQT